MSKIRFNFKPFRKRSEINIMTYKIFNHQKKIWITWEYQRRNRELAKRLGVSIYELGDIDLINNRLIKYSYALLKTTHILIKTKPKIVFCQNPSIVLAFFSCVISKIISFKVIVDAHNAGIYPLENRSKLLMIVSRYIQRHAHLYIVSNEFLKDVVEKNGGNYFVLPDPLPIFENHKKIDLKNKFNILFICTYAEDEPYKEVFKAVDYLNDNFHIYITGNYNKISIKNFNLSHKITLLGYISDKRFIEFLHSVDITIDLTYREDCLVCGAYESIAAEKPMILSKTKALQNFFNGGAVFTENYAQTIAECIHKAHDNYQILLKEIQQVKTDMEYDWCKLKENLKEKINAL